VIGNCLLQQCLDHIEVLDFHWIYQIN
jgi:hypothetical protein